VTTGTSFSPTKSAFLSWVPAEKAAREILTEGAAATRATQSALRANMFEEEGIYVECGFRKYVRGNCLENMCRCGKSVQVVPKGTIFGFADCCVQEVQTSDGFCRTAGVLIECGKCVLRIDIIAIPLWIGVDKFGSANASETVLPKVPRNLNDEPANTAGQALRIIFSMGIAEMWREAADMLEAQSIMMQLWV
jgi:hypothetical protein